jgi:hypothetical protein
MATSNVSALDQDTYQLIATNTPRTGSSTTFSSLSGYKKYIIAFDGLGGSSAGGMNMTFNGASTLYYGGTHIAGGTTYQAENSNIQLGYNVANLRGTVTIENVNNGAPKIVNGITNYDYQSNTEINYVIGGWTNASAITSITINCGGTYNRGSVSLYGIAG